MVSKKDLLVLGLVAAGGIGVASTIAGSGEKERTGVSGGTGFKPFGGIVGSNKAIEDTGDNAGLAPIIFPPEGKVTFPPVPAFRIPEFPFTPEDSGEGSGETPAGFAPTGLKPTPSGVSPTGLLPTGKKRATINVRRRGTPQVVGGHPTRPAPKAPAPKKHAKVVKIPARETAHTHALLPTGRKRTTKKLREHGRTMVVGSSRRGGGGRTTASTSTSSTKAAAPKSKKKPRSYGFSARSLGGGWSTGY